VKVDLDSIPPGETRLVSWKGRPVFVRNRTDEELRRARAVDPAALPDRLARNAALDAAAPATDERRTLPTHRKWLVVSGSCTHLGCLLRSESLPQRLESGLGWFCPCHAARFDLSGRLVSGPARTNLAVPRYAITGRTLVIAAR
jgi:ubiquinol-cytochrome c reductase iron-sulfur subunit